METKNWNALRYKLDFASASKPALVGAAALIVMVAVLAGRILIDTATANEFEIVPAASAETQEDASGGSAAGGSSGTAVEGDGEGEAASEGRTSIFVHVSGSVADPGLYELGAGSRVADAVKAAGGFADDAAADSVNLARSLADGEQIRVLSAGEAETAALQVGAAGDVGTPSLAVGASGLVNINSASAAELETLSGIGPSTAQKIVSYRENNGPFASKEDLKRVSGIGDKKYEALADSICV